MTIALTRERLSADLRTYGEDELAARALHATEEEMHRIGERGAEHAYTGMLIAKAVALAAIEVFEGRPRPPRWSRRKLKGIEPEAPQEPRRIRPAGASKTIAPLVKEVNKIIDEELTGLGLQRRREGFFTIVLGPEVLGCVGLLRTPRRGEGSFELYPGVSATYEPLERLLAELEGRKYQLCPTIGSPLCYLMPGKSYRVWTFSYGADNRAVVLDMKLAIQTYGFPFMKENGTREAILRNVPNHWIKVRNDYLLPVLYYMSGDNALARQEVTRALAGLQGQEHPYALHYRKFAARLFARTDDSPKG